jgi:hypothetical protein
MKEHRYTCGVSVEMETQRVLSLVASFSLGRRGPSCYEEGTPV